MKFRLRWSDIVYYELVVDAPTIEAAKQIVLTKQFDPEDVEEEIDPQPLYAGLDGEDYL